MVDPSICCSEHDVLMCFSEHGGTLMMSWISWPEPRRRVVDVLQRVEEKGLLGLEYCLGGCGLDELWSWTSWTLSLGRINHSAWKPEAGGGDPDPGEGTKARGQEPGTWRQEPGTWRQEPGSRKLDCTIVSSSSLSLELTSSRSLGHQTLLSIVLGCTCARSERIHSLIGDVWPGEWAVILDSIQTRGLDQVVYSSVNPVGMMSWPGRM
ncbi:hypothetical protein F2Q68_00010468 [Brassica cretica]|uniref:Uncharacterized protein n=1 Tax=Brassica cretica TaxID=69181 RepID=A0A8S9L2F2_BRACR|nr:hypothetical protein F2Q68_00010468 [Brassica cretica]